LSTWPNEKSGDTVSPVTKNGRGEAEGPAASIPPPGGTNWSLKMEPTKKKRDLSALNLTVPDTNTTPELCSEGC
jgi:hypothetical protein